MSAKTRDASADTTHDVVTAFLWDGRRVLLALRSAAVSTFPGHWAAISGYLEGADPLRWALVEVAEECGLERRHLTLRGAAAPLVAEDPRWGSFRVHPVLLEIDAPEAVRPDWEAERFEWVAVGEFLAAARQPTVPRLVDAFRAVWPPWEPLKSIEENARFSTSFLRDDRRLGAGALARAAAWEVAKLVRLSGGVDDKHQSLSRLSRAIDALRGARRAMAAPRNLLDDVGGDIARLEAFPEVLEAIAGRVEASLAAEQEVARRAAEQLARFRRPLTISRSGTVLSALRLAASGLERVFVCEGRPLCEGRGLASSLADDGIAVTAVCDAAAWAMMAEADCVFVGADALLVGGDVVNKCGTALLALAARHHGRPVLVAAERLKWERAAGDVDISEQNAASEVWDKPPQGIELANPYFDRVPATLISQWISEDGDMRAPSETSPR